MDDGNSDKNAKGTNKCAIKRMLNFLDYKDCLLDKDLQQRFESESNNLYSEEVKKIALSNNDDKRLQTYDRIPSYPYGTSAGEVCKTEMLIKVNIND